MENNVNKGEKFSSEQLLSDIGMNKNFYSNIDTIQNNNTFPLSLKEKALKSTPLNKNDVEEMKIVIDFGGGKEEVVSFGLNESPSMISRQISSIHKLSNEVEQKLANLLENKIQEKKNYQKNSNNLLFSSPIENIEIGKNKNIIEKSTNKMENINLKNHQIDMKQQPFDNSLHINPENKNIEIEFSNDKHMQFVDKKDKSYLAKSAKNLRNNEKIIPGFNESKLINSKKKYSAKKNNGNKNNGNNNLNKSQNIQTFINYGNVFERLYDHASIQKSEKNNKIKEEEKKKLEKQLLGLTLTPDISINSKKLFYKRNSQTNERINFHFIHEKKFIPEALNSSSNNLFSPLISKNSIILAQKNRSKLNEITTLNKFTELYSEFKKRKDNVNHVSTLNTDEECTFQPNKTNKPKILMKEKEKKILFDKLSKAKNKFNSILNLVTTEKVNFMDNMTHAPKILRPPIVDRNPEKKPIGEFLYMKSKGVPPIDLRHENNTKIPVISNTSEKLFNNLKINSFKEIFKILDEDQDGYISSHKMNTES